MTQKVAKSADITKIRDSEEYDGRLRQATPPCAEAPIDSESNFMEINTITMSALFKACGVD